MIHYHGLPITPIAVTYALAGRSFCVSYATGKELVELAHGIGQSVMLDNGAFTTWKQGKPLDHEGFAEWCEPWLDYPTTWAVIPDVIDGDEADNDRLLDWWATTGLKGAPVWHLHENLDRMKRLCADYERVCVGSSGDYSTPGSAPWHRRMEEMFSHVADLPWLHMLRGMSLSGGPYPFASVDSCAIGLNHWRSENGPLTTEQKVLNARRMADRWDSKQCPAAWSPRQLRLAA